MSDKPKSNQSDKPTSLQAAQTMYDTTAAAYHRLTQVPTRAMPAAERAAHAADCREALCEKRYRAAVVDALLRQRPVPNKADLVECRE
jgi:hypothetical protein